MAKQKARVRRRRRRDALVYAHLENVSRDLLERHPEVVRDFIGRNAGVYALYRKSRLYYVGLATALRGRLKAHIKNRHSNSWDTFSIYLTIRDQHLREIEALLLRIASPIGAKQRGKLAQSKDLKRAITREIKRQQGLEVSSLFRKVGAGARETATAAKFDTDPELIKFLPNGARLKGTNNGRIFKARVRRDGRVRYDGRYYQSLSVAAKAAIRRSVNGWWFWQVERGKGNWVRLTTIRKAGTPVYSR